MTICTSARKTCLRCTTSRSSPPQFLAQNGPQCKIPQAECAFSFRSYRLILLSGTLQTSKKTASSATPSSAASRPAPATAAPKEQKKRAGFKAKAKAVAAQGSRGDGDNGHVLGGADYVELMLGGRRKAAAEAVKLPRDPEQDA